MAQVKIKSRVGLDIGSHSIKMVEISNSPDKPALAASGIRKITDSSKEALASSVKSLAGEIGISVKDAAISVSGSSVITRFISMPRMKEEDLRGALKFEAEKCIPFNMSDCVMDFQVLRKIDLENKLEILLVAAKKGYVEERMGIAESAGLSVKIIDVDSLAIANSFVKNHAGSDPERTYAVLNIGSTLTNLSIIRNGLICFVRDITIGGGDFNSAISKGLSIDIETVESLKLSPQDKLPEVTASVKGALANLWDEVRLSFSYYENQYGRNVDEIYLSGGSAAMAGMEEQFQESFGLKPGRWNPFQFLETPQGEVSRADANKDCFAVAVGLALR